MRRLVIRGGLLVAVVVAIGLSLLPRALPSFLAWGRPDILFRGGTDKPRLFVTIDDAPSESTAAILAVLKKHRVPATLFVIGNRVRSDLQLSRIVDSGYTLGNHLRTTERCSRLSIERFKEDFDFTDHLLRRYSPSEYFRPPSDLGTREQMVYARSRNVQPVLGTVFPLDHWIQRPALLGWLVRWLAVPGGIIIMHDGDSRGRTTAQVLDDVLPRLKRAGYQFEALPTTERSLGHAQHAEGAR